MDTMHPDDDPDKPAGLPILLGVVLSPLLLAGLIALVLYLAA